jgi:hypothetical protein
MVELQQSGGDFADFGQSGNLNVPFLEMVCPSVSARIKEPNQLAALLPDGTKVGAFVPVTRFSTLVRPPCFRLRM